MQSIKNVHGFWLPEGEEHLTNYANGPGWTYQKNKLDFAMQYVKNYKVAVDVGGHCGLWSIHLVKDFNEVFAFEPIPVHQECFERNVPEAHLIKVALGDKEAEVHLKWNPKSTGDTTINAAGIPASMKTLDSFNLKEVGFMKLDTEGYELNILKGAEITIEDWHPVIVVEQKPNKAQQFGLKETEAVSWLQERGYELMKVMAGDYIMV